MSERYHIAVVGAGPGGLSAAARAAQTGVSHILLEQSPAHANTIQRYQKGKHVMAEPGILPLRSPLKFEVGTREKILGEWADGLGEHQVNVRYNADVTAISGSRGDFRLTLKSGEEISAEYVIFAIGLQGNPRRLGVPGDDLPCVQYTLDDPDEYKDETILVVGAGDAAIENAVALSKQNKVIIVNRSGEFARCKDGNLALILKHIEEEKLDCLYKTQCSALSTTPEAEKPYLLTLSTDKGEINMPCHRIIARLGAIAPRKFVESCGIRFPSTDPAALPELSPQYESSVPGLYVIGALAGYPLIKQAMNQGYEVVESIMGRECAPADEPLLAKKFARLPGRQSVSEVLAAMQSTIPLFSDVNPLMFRELILGSEIHVPAAGEAIFRRNDYTNTFFSILSGSVEIEVGEGAGARRIPLSAGQFFGEMGLLSGRRRTATVYAGKDCVLIETPRRDMIKLISSVDAVREVIDRLFITRTIQTGFAPKASFEDLQSIAARAKINKFKPNQVVFAEGDHADSLHLIRNGSVSISRTMGGSEVVISYVAAGNYVGEMGLLGNTSRSATVRATVPTETISLDATAFGELLDHNPELRAEMEGVMRKRVSSNAQTQASAENSGGLISFMIKQGLGEATDILLIDESLCVGCDNCEKACAGTHGGTSRLDRAAGPTFANVHVPTSCRHCEDPHCMKDCPPDAIRRSPSGEVYIQDNCIGCGNCERNCPYGVIHMSAPKPAQPSLLSSLLFGLGENKKVEYDKKALKKAVKCDMCKDLSGGPACVRACPTGAALRVSPQEFVDYVTTEAAER